MRALILIAAAACSSSPATAPGPAKPPPNAADLAACASDDECTLVEACCGCSAAGKRVAIRVDAVAEYDRTRPARCSGSTCPTAISTHSSCHAEAVCRDGRCAVQPHLRPD
ncbi:MAG: hypothetical protein KF773_21045 [Deltaproteobacteria bacterium]|nr:hypothetical protein [Deltaproteobacteria bacterium]